MWETMAAAPVQDSMENMLSMTRRLMGECKRFERNVQALSETNTALGAFNFAFGHIMGGLHRHAKCLHFVEPRPESPPASERGNAPVAKKAPAGVAPSSVQASTPTAGAGAGGGAPHGQMSPTKPLTHGNVAKRLTKKLPPRFRSDDHLRALLVLRRFIKFRGEEGAALNEIVRQRVAPTVLQCNEYVGRAVEAVCACVHGGGAQLTALADSGRRYLNVLMRAGEVIRRKETKVCRCSSTAGLAHLPCDPLSRLLPPLAAASQGLRYLIKPRRRPGSAPAPTAVPERRPSATTRPVRRSVTASTASSRRRAAAATRGRGARGRRR